MKGGKLVPAPLPTRTPHWHHLPPAHPPLEGIPCRGGGRPAGPCPGRVWGQGHAAEISLTDLGRSQAAALPLMGVGRGSSSQMHFKVLYSHQPLGNRHTKQCYTATVQLGQVSHGICFGSAGGAHIFLSQEGNRSPDFCCCCCCCCSLAYCSGFPAMPCAVCVVCELTWVSALVWRRSRPEV